MVHKLSGGGVALLLIAVAVVLHGCGGGGGTTTTTTQPPTTTTKTTTTTKKTATTTMTTTTQLKPKPVPGPAPPATGNFTALKHVIAISYNGLPPPATKGGSMAYKDVAQIGYEKNWGKDGRDDLGTIKRLGANSVKIEQGLGSEWLTDHGPFLDRAYELGLHVIAGFQTAGFCPDDYNCFDFWKNVTKHALQNGYMKDKKWHPAVAMLVLMDQPDELNFVGVAHPVNISTHEGAMMRTKAVVSAFDAVLAAEAEMKVDGSGVNLTVAWGCTPKDSFDKTMTDSYMYGFQDVTYGIKNTKELGYTPTTQASTLEGAFNERWVHGLNCPSNYQFVSGKMEGYRQRFPKNPWFLAEWKALDGAEDLEAPLKQMDRDSRALQNNFIGFSLGQFQQNAEDPAAKFMYSLGDTALAGKVTPCKEDVRTKVKECANPPFAVNCLTSKDRADQFAKAFAGNPRGHGTCADKFDEQIVI